MFDPFESPYRSAAPVPVITPRRFDDRVDGQGAGPASSTTAGEPSATLPDATQPFVLRDQLAKIERNLIETALEVNRHHQRRTAKHLGLSYHQFRNLLKKYELLPTPE